MWHLTPIKAASNPLKPLAFAAFLSAPIVSAWIWNSGKAAAQPVPDPRQTTTQRLPVEIIAAEAQPKWVLVPIDPG